ncbi:telomere stability and silencing-domain-containing protein [Geranomyces variabilis]|nr:telomere stability and silencing-domain-containing protein [Geranomyces variabilis]
MPSTQVILNLPAGLAPLCLHSVPSSSCDSAPPTLHDLQLLLPTLLPAALLELSPRLTSHTGALLPPTHPLTHATNDANPHPLMLTLTPRLRGGKGGFGSMLRAQGGKMASQKTTNFDSCRDLAGRRLKTVNDARALADYLEHEPARKRKREEAKVEKLEKLAAANQGSSSGARKARFHDPEFEDAHREVMEDVVGAVGRALELQKGAENGKGKESVVPAKAKSATNSPPAKAKVAPVVGADLSAWDALSDPESAEDEDDDEESGSDGEEVWQEEKADGDKQAAEAESESAGSSSSSEVHAAEVVEAAKKTLESDVEPQKKTAEKKAPKKKAKK